MSLKTQGSISFYDCSVDRLSWVIKWQEEPIPLSRKSFDLLLYLIDHRDRVVSKDELLEKLWPEQFIEESSLTQQIFLLRKAFSKHGADQKIIQTVSGRGYRFIAPVMEPDKPAEQNLLTATESVTRITVEEEEDDSAALGSASVQRLSAGSVAWKSQRFALIAAASLAALAFGGWAGWQRWENRSGSAPVQVVLVPFEGTTGDAILDKALTQALRMDLAQSPYVTVLPASTVMATLSEMVRKPDDKMTPATAREVCERTNSQGVLSGNIAKVGQQFLITAEASNCVDGSVIGQSKYEANGEAGLPHAIDKLASTLRSELGESRRSTARFNTPLLGQNTRSLDALKAFTQGLDLDRKGESVQAVAFYKLAIVDDPDFAWAYYSLATSSANAGDFAAGREASAKAYSMRDTAGKQQAFAITALYNVLVTQDLYESLRNYQAYAGLYPNSSSAWNGLAYVQADLGKYADAAASDRRAVALAPQNQNSVHTLALSLIQSGEAQAAKKMLDQAVAMKIDDNFIRVRYFELACLLHDEALLRAQNEWSDVHPTSAIVLMTRAEIANAEGRFAEARRLIARANQVYREQGDEGAGEQYTKALAVQMMEAGDESEGKRLFSESPADPEEGEQVLGLAFFRNVSAAQFAIRAMKTKYPKGTLWNLYWGPMTQAVIALQENKAREAVSLLELPRPIESRELRVPWLRGNAYLASGQPALAEANYRAVVNHPEWDPTSPCIPLSWLGLGRALAAEGNRPPAIEAYKHFLSLWAHADPDAINLKEAKQEVAALQTAKSAT